jgi:N-acetylmuramoyl-L-alanine amidase
MERMIVRRRIGNWLGCMAVLGSFLALTPAHSVAAPSPLGSLGLSGKPLRGYKICVDPGHGGQSARDGRYTGGTFGVATRQTESDVNLRVSLMLAQFLEEAGATVILTRTTDNRVQDKPDMGSELDARSRYANSRRADFFISMHHNHGPRGTNYTAVFYHRNSSVSGKLADQISASLAFCLGTPNIGSRASAYRVLKGLKMPGVIVECSFMTNSSEDARLANLAYNKLQAKGVAVGIINYIRQTKGRGVDFILRAEKLSARR